MAKMRLSKGGNCRCPTDLQQETDRQDHREQVEGNLPRS